MYLFSLISNDNFKMFNRKFISVNFSNVVLTQSGRELEIAV